MKSLFIENVPVFRTEQRGKMFVKERKLSLQDFFRFMKKLHWDALLERDNLVQALLEKDGQRLKRHIHKYVKTECAKLHDCAVFMRTDVTVQEMVSMGYIIYYRIFAELEVKEVPEEE